MKNMNANTITEWLRKIGIILFISCFLIDWLYKGNIWLYILYPGCIMIFIRMVYEMIHFKEYKKTNIHTLIMFPIIFITILILSYFGIL